MLDDRCSSSYDNGLFGSGDIGSSLSSTWSLTLKSTEVSMKSVMDCSSSPSDT